MDRTATRRSSSSLRSGPRFSSEDGARVRMTVCRPDFGRGGAVEVHEVVPTVMTRFRSAEGVPVAVDAYEQLRVYKIFTPSRRPSPSCRAIAAACWDFARWYFGLGLGSD